MSSTSRPNRVELISRPMWPLPLCCVALLLTTQAATVGVSHSTCNTDRCDPPNCQLHPDRPSRPWPQARQCRHQAHRLRVLPTQRQSTDWLSTPLGRSVRAIRGGRLHESRGDDNNPSDRVEADEQGRSDTSNIPAVEKIEQFAADLRTKRDDIVENVRAQGEAMAEGLKVKQEKLADEVLRDRSPEAFGGLAGHHTYDSATAGLDVANRRAFFLGIRRVVLLVQVVELILACSWQVGFPYGGVAGFLAGDYDQAAPASEWVGCLRDARGRLGIAVAAALGQAALYTALMVFFGCDRVVLRAVRVTGWEHGAAAAWSLYRAFGAAGGLDYLAASAWLSGIAFLCVYFGRQL